MKKVVRIENAKPGGIIAQDVVDLRGNVLFKSGLELTDDMIHMMQLRNVTHLFLEELTAIRTPAAFQEGSNEEEIQTALNDAFAKVADDPKKRRKLVRRKAPEGMVPWGEATLTRLVDAAPEALTSNMRVSTAMILDVVDRPGDPFEAMRRLLTDNHEPRKRQLRLIREAVGIARSLLQAGVIRQINYQKN